MNFYLKNSLLKGESNMSKKNVIIISAILFIILAALLICEIKNPNGGAALLDSLQ